MKSPVIPAIRGLHAHSSHPNLTKCLLTINSKTYSMSPDYSKNAAFYEDRDETVLRRC